MAEDIRHYIEIMIESLEKKEALLVKIVEKNAKQTAILGLGDYETVDWDEFNVVVGEKEILIDRIEELDQGFQTLFDRIGNELKDNKELYSEKIGKLQKQIRTITDLGSKIVTGEERNRSALEKLVMSRKKEIKETKKSVQAASTYYRAMSGIYGANDYGSVDKKK